MAHPDAPCAFVRHSYPPGAHPLTKRSTSSVYELYGLTDEEIKIVEEGT